MSGSGNEKDAPNTNITSLFFNTTLTLAGVGDKSYIKLNDREDYISSRNKQIKSKELRTQEKKREKLSEHESIICQINLVYSQRFQSLKEIQLHKDYYLTTLHSNIFRPYKALFKSDEYFTDAEIDMLNACSKYRYPSNNILSLKSSHIQILGRDEIICSIDNCGKKNGPYKPKIMNLFDDLLTTENNRETAKTNKSKNMTNEYVRWYIGKSSLLKKYMKKITGNYSIITANISLMDAHWVFLVGVDFYDETLKNNNSIDESIRFYLFDSMHYQKDAIKKHELDKNEIFDNFYISLTRLWKLLFIMKRNNSGTNTSFVFEVERGFYNLKINRKTVKTIQAMKDVVYRVKTTQQGDNFTCGQHIVRYFDEIMRINHERLPSKLDKISFERKLLNSIQLKLYAGECRKLRSESLEYVLNTNLAISIFIKKFDTKFLRNDFSFTIQQLMDDVLQANEEIERAIGKIRLKKNTRSKQMSSDDMFETIKNEVATFKTLVQGCNEDRKLCQCNIKFPSSALRRMSSSELKDIHAFSFLQIQQLSWTCPRTGQKGKGSFYSKFSPTNTKQVYGMDNIVTLVQKLGPEINEDFEHNGLKHCDIFKDMLLRRLSLLCNFTPIDIPDGGSCCDWIVGAVILNESNSSSFATYLNTLRKKKHLAKLVFDAKNSDIIRQIRLSYAASISYDYDPNISELLNLDEENDDVSLNELYCSAVLWQLKKICSHDRKEFATYTFQECIRKFISLTPSDVGKYGCMWGTNDFLHWFQRLYNVRVFVINIQNFAYKFTYGDFVNNALVYEGTSDGKERERENKNDKYFDLSDPDRLIPYGIIIVLMENEHFDKVFKLHGESSLIIPAGSQKISFLLPYLDISPTLWSSLSTDEILDHNGKILDNGRMDTFKDLNVWFDHSFAEEGMSSTVNHFSQIPFNENIQNRNASLDFTTCSSIPYCSIRFSPIYLGSLIYFSALQLNDDCKALIEVVNSCSINLMESDTKREKKFKRYLSKQIQTNRKTDVIERNIFDIEFLAKNWKGSMKVYTDEYYQTIAASLFGSDKIKDVDNIKLTKRIKYPLEENMVKIDPVTKTIIGNSQSNVNSLSRDAISALILINRVSTVV